MVVEAVNALVGVESNNSKECCASLVEVEVMSSFQVERRVGSHIGAFFDDQHVGSHVDASVGWYGYALRMLVE